MELNEYNLRLNQAAQSPKPEKPPEYKNVSMRIDQDLFKLLESMAKVLGKSTSGLAGELLETMIIRFDEELPSLRPDLIIRENETGFDEFPNGRVREDEEGEFLCRWDSFSDAVEISKNVQQNLFPQEDAKNGKAKE